MFASQMQLVREIHRISRIHVTVAGREASDHDSRQFQSVTLLRYGLEADLRGLSSLGESTYRRVIHSLQEVDLLTYAKDLKYVKLTYLALWQGSQELAWQQFKPAVSGSVHYKWILSLVEKLWSSPRAVLQWLAFDERLLLDSNSDTSDEEAAYVRFEEVLRDRTYDPALMEELSSIISVWLKDFSLAEVPPRPTFGPGAVADWEGRTPVLEKAVRLVYDADTVRTLCEYWACDEDDLMVGEAGEASWINRIVFVPKNALSHRIISAEPVWLTWLQHAIQERLYEYVERHRNMYTWFSDQETSRSMALRGSIDGSYATIDYSSASDSVTTVMVDQLFCKTYIHEPLLITRSRVAELPSGEFCKLHKYAPMGSALCFPVMDIIILAVCEWSIRKALGRPSRYGDYCVYGDDAIIRKEAVEAFRQASLLLGLSVNTDKSYWKSTTPHFYRESCGIEAMDGTDVTPLRYSRKQEPLIGMSPAKEGAIESVIALCNRAYADYGFANLRSVAQEVVTATCAKEKSFMSIWGHVLRVDYSDWKAGVSGPNVLVVPDGTATNYRCDSRWNAELQRREVRVRYSPARSTGRSAEDDEDTLYRLWFFYADNRRLYSGKHDEFLSNATGTRPQKWVWGWFNPKG